MTAFEKKIAAAVSKAFVGSLELQASLKKLGTKTASFKKDVATLIARDANKFYGLKGDKEIIAYMGQRGWAFGIKTGEKNDGTPTFTRDKRCDSTRKWMEYNVFQKKVKKAKAKSPWAKIVAMINGIDSVASIDKAIKALKARRAELA
jgi:hypothetical protein